MAVLPDQQNRGVGTRLLKQALDQMKQAGFTEARIGTGNSSLGQLYLYQKLGFRMDSIRKDFFTNLYPEEIRENGLVCRDMVMLRMELQ